MEISQLIPHVEALIFAADRPLPAADILELLNNALAFLEDRATQEQVDGAIEAIQEKYNSEFYAFCVRESGGGYQFLTKKDYYQTVAQLNGEKFLKRLSTAALETLAIIAYKQPISKGEIEHIRGVSTDYSITKLLEKELIVISGRSETLPGKPLLYSTSKAFMDYFGLNSPKDLPQLKELFEEDFVAPTQLTIEGGIEELRVDDEELLDENGQLIVLENGELTETTTVMMEDDFTGEVSEEDDLDRSSVIEGEEDVPEIEAASAVSEDEGVEVEGSEEESEEESGEEEIEVEDNEDAPVVEASVSDSETEESEEEVASSSEEEEGDESEEEGDVSEEEGEEEEADESEGEDEEEGEEGDEDEDEESDEDDEDEDEDDEEEDDEEDEDDEDGEEDEDDDDEEDEGDDEEKEDDEEAEIEGADDRLNDEEEDESDEDVDKK
ncbi:SMC-Scp complex subunit ScpB [Chitinophaga sp. SYP-B3965]|uniref:SMC-Scp complex subunit ScpB n=1 Tax=Chitinophaga sp. SYP-B3965 TaxID=2663120 RepID=UPI0012999724|nr:SMC-Scp complex subunit ScpB [Chitinophaga sp. SYP-B3965]MRG48868.1 SMC-Scp complex subunit ScpB [Chitinophaga sp. SYP-B3965]